MLDLAKDFNKFGRQTNKYFNKGIKQDIKVIGQTVNKTVLPSIEKYAKKASQGLAGASAVAMSLGQPEFAVPLALASGGLGGASKIAGSLAPF